MICVVWNFFSDTPSLCWFKIIRYKYSLKIFKDKWLKEVVLKLRQAESSSYKTKLFNTMKNDDKYEVEKSVDSCDLLCGGAYNDPFIN